MGESLLVSRVLVASSPRRADPPAPSCQTPPKPPRNHPIPTPTPSLIPPV